MNTERIPLVFKAMFLIPIIVGILLISAFMIDPVYGVWVDRDMLRASQVFDSIPVMGAELNGTYYARTPGGAYYYALALLTAISNDPATVTRLLIVLSVFGGVAIYSAANSVWGKLPALVAAGFWLTSPMVLGAGFEIINPAFGVPISGFCYLFLIRYMKGHEAGLIWLAALLGILVQMHISFSALVITLAAAVLFLRPPGWRTAALAIVTFLLMLSPYIVVEAMNGFVNTELLRLGRDDPNPIYTSVKFDVLKYFVRHITAPVCSDITLTCGAIDPRNVTFAGGLFVLFVVFLRVVFALFRWTSGKVGRVDERHSEKIVIALGVVLAVGIVMLVVGRGFGPQPRYYLFLAPAIALLLAALVRSILVFSSRLQSSNYHQVYVLVAVIFVGLTIGRVATLTDKIIILNLPETRISKIKSVVDAVKIHTGYNGDEFNKRVVVINEGGAVKEYFTAYMARWRLDSQEPNTLLKPVCLAIVEGDSDQISSKNLALYFARVPFKPISVTTLGRVGNLSLFGYGLANGNCYRSVGNSYDHSPEERLARQQCDKADEKGVVWSRKNEGELAYVVHDTFDSTRFCFYIDFVRSGDRLMGTIHSWQGRHYTGYPMDQWNFRKLNLRFVSNDMSVDRDLITAPLGRYKLSRMPWSFSIEVAQGQRYDVSLNYILEQQVSGRISDEIPDDEVVVHRNSHQLPHWYGLH